MEYDVIQESWKDHLTESDFWQVEGVKVPIISHRGVEKLARVFEVDVLEYEWVSSIPEFLLVMIRVGNGGSEVYEVGEANPNNLGAGISADYPASMAWKRGYDRAVLKLLGIEAYSAEEASNFGRRNESKVLKNPSLANPIGITKVEPEPITPQVVPQQAVYVPNLEPATHRKVSPQVQQQAQVQTQWINPQTVQPKVESPKVGQVTPQQYQQFANQTGLNPQTQVVPQQSISQPSVNPIVQPPVNNTPVIMPQTEAKPITRPQINAINQIVKMLNQKNTQLGQPQFDLNTHLGRNLDTLTSEDAGSLIRELNSMISGQL